MAFYLKSALDIQPGQINAIANALKEAQTSDNGELQRRTDFETARKSILVRTEGDWLQVGPCPSFYSVFNGVFSHWAGLQDLYDLWQAEIEALRQHSSFAPQSITGTSMNLRP